VFEGLTRLAMLDRPAIEILRDLGDILIVAFILYRALLVLKGTRAMQMGIGFAAFGLLYVLARYAEFATLMRVLDFVAPSAILIIVVVFQNDIRRALIRVGEKAWFSRGRDMQERVFEEVVAAATELARHRMGAIICLERDANVLEFVTNDGLLLDSLITRELLVSLFVPESVNKTHDGAVLINKDLRLARAGIFFPMPQSTKVSDPTLGSRHRAAIGITEETDAVLIVVSEERGTITLFADNSMAANMDGPSLRVALDELVRGTTRDKQRTLLQRLGFGREVKTDAATPSTKQPASAKPASSTKTASSSKTAGSSKTASKSSPTKSIPPKAPSKTTKDPQAGSSGKHTAIKALNKPAPAKATSKSGRHTAQNKDGATSRSGRFTPIGNKESAKASTEEEDTRTPQQTRASVPMPTAKDRKSSESKRDKDKDLDKDRESVEAPARRSVSKPMTPTELPGSPAPKSRGDS
jgi:diadenylate cyclase